MFNSDLGKIILKDFIKNSFPSIKPIVKTLKNFKENNSYGFFKFYDNKAHKHNLTGNHFFLRTSVEYSNPQLTVEEVQGIIAARLIEVCGNYAYEYELDELDKKDMIEISEKLNGAPEGIIYPFMLITDDVEPDRYSMNPLKNSIVESGQSAFPSANVKTENLAIDRDFFHKYKNSLISESEVEIIKNHLANSNNSYMNMVEAVKYEQLNQLSELFCIDLKLCYVRMPISIFKNENKSGVLHKIIKEAHKNYESIENVYRCMGRSMKKKRTLLTTPHSKKGYGSKRAARGKIVFKNNKLEKIKISYKTTYLYYNAIDPKDISIAKADDSFEVVADKFLNYDYSVTPSSPQFILYSLLSPENAVLWHGIGKFGASQLVKSYVTTKFTCIREAKFLGMKKYLKFYNIPLQFNLIPKHMWVHPKYDNIDASIGCVKNLGELSKKGMKLEYLQSSNFLRN